jgi:phospholipase/carboxylesterase
MLMNDSTNPRPSGVLLESSEPVTAAVIWLHGLGADGHDFEPLVPLLDPPAGTRFYFPHAPKRPITINGGLVMRGWYDIRHDRTAEDEEGIRQSGQAVLDMIAHELSLGIRPERIVLAGFSQGGAIALHAGLRFPGRLGGILALSTYLPLPSHLAGEAHAASRDTPILMAHGLGDEIIPISSARRSARVLEAAGYHPEWREFPMGHTVSSEEIPVIAAWLRQRIPPEK